MKRIIYSDSFPMTIVVVICIVFLVMGIGCGQPVNSPEGRNASVVNFEYDGCEYLIRHEGWQNETMVHKGNCKNKIHIYKDTLKSN